MCTSGWKFVNFYFAFVLFIYWAFSYWCQEITFKNCIVTFVEKWFLHLFKKIMVRAVYCIARACECECDLVYIEGKYVYSSTALVVLSYKPRPHG